jgi:hypothetical protein
MLFMVLCALATTSLAVQVDPPVWPNEFAVAFNFSFNTSRSEGWLFYVSFVCCSRNVTPLPPLLCSSFGKEKSLVSPVCRMGKLIPVQDWDLQSQRIDHEVSNRTLCEICTWFVFWGLLAVKSAETLASLWRFVWQPCMRVWFSSGRGVSESWAREYSFVVVFRSFPAILAAHLHFTARATTCMLSLTSPTFPPLRSPPLSLSLSLSLSRSLSSRSLALSLSFSLVLSLPLSLIHVCQVCFGRVELGQCRLLFAGPATGDVWVYFPTSSSLYCCALRQLHGLYITPTWLQGATYVGTQIVNGKRSAVWLKQGYVYADDVLTQVRARVCVCVCVCVCGG